MNNFGAIIHQRLANDAAVAALVADRIWPEEAPDDAALPLVVYSVTVGESGDGTAVIAPGTVRVNGWCEDDDTAQQLGEAIGAALHDYSGSMVATHVRCLSQSDYQEARSFEFNLWGRLLTFTGQVITG
jgi:hypothetical protein